MSKKLLIDAAHKEETRVALIDEQNRLMEYDIETTNKQTIKGNIYLAKVMRVEPSLQAAFVDYGGSRHGFLAFSEIHPDYFRIPVSDREALAAKLADAIEDPDEEIQEKEIEIEGTEHKKKTKDEISDDYKSSVSTIAGESVDHSDDDHREDARKRRPALHKMYKIQEVIHKNQILLIQVSKEERGQKGAALTTYISLAGRYCVLMPNSPQAGGISRKISNPKERKALREALAALKLSKEMGLIIRTAGRGHTKAEIKRDTDYLTRQWDEIRSLTLKSIAPLLIYQEDSIIKRVIRDQYSKEISAVLIEGEACYKSAKAFMRKLLPSHAKNIQLYKNNKVPLFLEHKIEQQVEKMHDSTVELPSGGSIVINPTEALVSIDINSGKATRERHIEQTALNTNIEAAAEIARQIRLRDLAGLVVIDFIDMDDRKYIHQVERKVRESFKNDRARVQMGKISPFGLLELSRQRLRPSILETSSQPCPHCQTTGHIRSTESMALLILRALEEEGIANRSATIKAVVPTDVAFYILNKKRVHLADIEIRHETSIIIEGDHNLIVPSFRMMQLERKGHIKDTEKTESKPKESQKKPDNRQKKTPQHKKQVPQKKNVDKNEKSIDKKTDQTTVNKKLSNPRRRPQNRDRDQNKTDSKTATDTQKSDETDKNKVDSKTNSSSDRGSKEGQKRTGRRYPSRRRPQNNKSNTGKPDNAKLEKTNSKNDAVKDTVVKESSKKVTDQASKKDENSKETNTTNLKEKLAKDTKPKTTRERKSWLKKLLE